MSVVCQKCSCHACICFAEPVSPAIQRVLKAARTCAEQWRKWSRPHTPPECRELMDAVDALDAPVERWRIIGGWLWDEYEARIQVGGGDLGMKIAQALNAADAREGKA